MEYQNDIQDAIALLMANQAMNSAEFAFARDYLLSCSNLIKNGAEKAFLRNLINRARIYSELRSAIATLNQHQIYPVEALYSDREFREVAALYPPCDRPIIKSPDNALANHRV